MRLIWAWLDSSVSFRRQNSGRRRIFFSSDERHQHNQKTRVQTIRWRKWSCDFGPRLPVEVPHSQPSKHFPPLERLSKRSVGFENPMRICIEFILRRVGTKSKERRVPLIWNWVCSDRVCFEHHSTQATHDLYQINTRRNKFKFKPSRH